jgi:hypothetical protein
MMVRRGQMMMMLSGACGLLMVQLKIRSSATAVSD